MNSLFPDEFPVFPPGFKYLPNFLTVEQETDLLEIISHLQLHTFIFQGFEARRKVASFGYDYHFQNRELKKGEPIPSAFKPLISKVSALIKKEPAEIDELLVTEYPPGAVINWHRDAPPFGLIAGISLLTDCIFKLKPHEKSRQKKGTTISLPVQRRSLYVMEGEAREEWQHSIAPVRSTRYSITLRTLK
jgi:alkylated DNA repair dioxygenase AlkB